MNYFLSVAIALDQLFNALIGGYPDETLCAAAYKGEKEGKFFPKIFRPVIDFIMSLFEKEHCKKAYESEVYGRQLPDVYYRSRYEK